MSEQSPAMEYITDFLKRSPEAAYGEINKGATEAGHKIYPIMYGRAKSLLGLLPEGSSKRRRRPAATGRKLRQGKGSRMSETAVSELSGFVDKFREMEDERNRYRAALISVERILRDALGGE